MVERHLVLHIFGVGVNIGGHPTLHAASLGAAVSQSLLVRLHPLVETLCLEAGNLELPLLRLQLRLFGHAVDGLSLFAVG